MTGEKPLVNEERVQKSICGDSVKSSLILDRSRLFGGHQKDREALFYLAFFTYRFFDDLVDYSVIYVPETGFLKFFGEFGSVEPIVT
ncbi:MAG: hypothetical protein ACLPQL_13580 [Desulfobaccales bacterium]